MSHLLPWLTDNVRNAAEKCGAVGASVYVPTPWNTTAPGVLVHVGAAPPLPEMATMEAAVEFAGRMTGRVPEGHDVVRNAATVRSAVAEGCFIQIPLLATFWQRSAAPNVDVEDAPTLARRLSDRHAGPPIVGWLGLRFPGRSDTFQHTGGWDSLLELASALASTYVCFYGILTDPVTGLPGRAELTGTVRAELERASSLGLPFSLLFTRIDDLDTVNGKYGRRAGDAVLRDFLDAVQRSVRSSDTVMRYGGAIFALPLRDVAAPGALIVGDKIRRTVDGQRFLGGSLQFPCAVGIASWDPASGETVKVLDLMGRAHQALSVARQEGCQAAVLWRHDGNMAAAEPLDPLLGVFTGQAERDYRNMRLLWDVLQALSGATGPEMSRAVVGRMIALFAATRAAIFQPGADQRLAMIVGQQRDRTTGAVAPLAPEAFGADEWHLVNEAVTTLTPRRRTLAGDGEGVTSPATAQAVPLVIEGRALGALYLQGDADVLKLDQTDEPVLVGVASQLALALDREELAAAQRVREQREQERLKAELDSLRSVLKQTRLVYRSEAMAALLNTTRRVASTDATVLITGESGTGKEMLARTLHELSRRRDKPLVIVDCGAIPASLMDSELFGRERGAYTGADRRAPGRLAQADGGTVFLDEIGELPLEVQAKLLRFVQEKTLTLVGGTREQRVDVRIVAATNRALEDEVRHGRFREDLFHRLNVVRLRIPSLRERKEDVLFFARHFLVTFAREYAKDVRRLDEAAERLLTAHDWPGNVRELQNTILQAVVLAEGDTLTPDDLQLELRLGTPVAPAHARAAQLTAPPVTTDRQRLGAAQPVGPAAGFDQACAALAARLETEIAGTVSSGTKFYPPLGKWLARDLVMAAHDQAGGVASRAAALLGLPETTFSRQLRQAEAEAASTRRPESWDVVRVAVSDVIRAADRPGGNLPDRIDDLLLQLVIVATPGASAQAALMGLSLPTLKRRLDHLHERTTPLAV